MGQFSWNCKICGRDMMSGWSCLKTETEIVRAPEWMKKVAVFMDKNTTLPIIGRYNGYGFVAGIDIRPEFRGDRHLYRLIHEPCCFHYECWKKAGRPPYLGPSISSPTQGFGDAGFFPLDEEGRFVVGKTKPIPPPSEWENFTLAWACNSVTEFFYNIKVMDNFRKYEESLDFLVEALNYLEKEILDMADGCK